MYCYLFRITGNGTARRVVSHEKRNLSGHTAWGNIYQKSEYPNKLGESRDFIRPTFTPLNGPGAAAMAARAIGGAGTGNMKIVFSGKKIEGRAKQFGRRTRFAWIGKRY